ncbi:MAG TPA: (2Fe-2S)-binding protein [Steroidobacteraceae bacterium]|jgi:carbon-monoxide dehydrogenase small subunit|nr:(2Fe-2S)-binding protein [Steroidobacteraceae bacterium]
MSQHLIRVKINGEEHEVSVPARRLLAAMLRDDLHMTGTKRGCETGICGACTVHLDGKPVKSCLALAVQADGRALTTIEGMCGADKALHPIQKAFLEHGGLQCGYCTPGFIMATSAFLAENPRPTEKDVRVALSGNLCRCTGYVGIVESVMAAARAMAEETKEVQG